MITWDWPNCKANQSAVRRETSCKRVAFQAPPWALRLFKLTVELVPWPQPYPDRRLLRRRSHLKLAHPLGERLAAGPRALARRFRAGRLPDGMKRSDDSPVQKLLVKLTWMMPWRAKEPFSRPWTTAFQAVRVLGSASDCCEPIIAANASRPTRAQQKARRPARIILRFCAEARGRALPSSHRNTVDRSAFSTFPKSAREAFAWTRRAVNSEGVRAPP